MALFGKKKKDKSAEGVPVDKVLQLRQQGYSNDQVIQSLQQEGYESSQIFDAMSQADIKGGVSGEERETPPAPPGGPAPQSEPVSQQPQQQESEQVQPQGQQQQYTQQQYAQQSSYGMPPPSSSQGYGMDRQAIEEIAESIIDEKWDALMKNVDKIVEWKEATESKITKLQQKVKDLKERFESLHSGVLSKLSEYDQGIKGVSSDINAMEEVFKKTLPTFTKNVKDLSKLAKKMKPSSKSKKSRKKKK